MDFYCAKAGLAIELDGSGHYEMEQIKRDEARTKALEAMNVHVARFCNSDVDRSFEQVCEAIDRAVKGSLHRPAAPEGETKTAGNSIRIILI